MTKEIDNILRKMSDGTMDADDRRQLQNFIAESQENKEYYLKHCRMESELEFRGGSLSKDLLKTVMNENRRNFMNAIVKIAALITISIVSLTIYSIAGKSSNSSLTADVKAPERGKSVAKMERSILATFKYGGKNGEEILDGDEVSSGYYELTNGIIKLTYKNGATVIVESPGKFELVDYDSMKLFSGKASIYSPDGANYKVHAPGVLVEDLGTEFSVEMVEGEHLDVHVYDGLVKVESNDESEVHKVHVKEGEAVRVIYDPNGQVIAGIDLRNDLFIRQISNPNDIYSKEIVKMDPVAYFPMDVMDNGVLKDYSIYKNNGISRNVQNESSFFTQGKFGSAIRISGANKKSYIYVPDYPKTKNSNITVMAWVYAKSRPKWATIMKNWTDQNKGQYHFGLSEHGYLDIEILPENIDFMKDPENKARQDLEIHKESIHMRENTRFPLYSWQHVAFVHDGNELRLYRNAKLVNSLKTPPMQNTDKPKMVSIGTKLRANEIDYSGVPGHWDGMLDEVAIFNYVMTEKELEYIYNQVYSAKSHKTSK